MATLPGPSRPASLPGLETIGFPAQGRQDFRFTVQHSWITDKGDIILFKPAVATADAASKPNVV